MRPDTVNRLISYMDIIIRKRNLDTDIKVKMIENIAATFKINPSRINIVIISTKEDIDSHTRPLYVINPNPMENNNFCIAIDISEVDKYNAERLVAVMVHDIIHNISTTTLRTRTISALYEMAEKYTTLRDYDHEQMIRVIGKYISSTPFSNYIIVDSSNVISGDEFLITYELDEAWNQAMHTFHNVSQDLWSAMKDTNGHNFEVFSKNIIQSAIDSDHNFVKKLGGYYSNNEIWRFIDKLDEELIQKGISFGSSNLSYTGKLDSSNYNQPAPDNCEPVQCNALNEGIMSIIVNPTDLRYQMDRIILSSNYIDTEDEKVFVLMKIKNLTKSLNDADEDLSKTLTKNPTDKASQSKQKLVQASLSELERLRATIVAKPIVPKRYSLWIETPSGYEG